MRPIDADALKEQFEETHQFYVFSWGGDFSKMPIRLKAACDELVNCIAEVVNAPTIDAVPHWIPCEERLPDERQDVYVTVLWDDYGDYVTAYGMRTKFGWNLHSNTEGELIKGYTVVAWMPLPEPYMGERKDND